MQAGATAAVCSGVDARAEISLARLSNWKNDVDDKGEAEIKENRLINAPSMELRRFSVTILNRPLYSSIAFTSAPAFKRTCTHLQVVHLGTQRKGDCVVSVVSFVMGSWQESLVVFYCCAHLHENPKWAHCR